METLEIAFKKAFLSFNWTFGSILASRCSLCKNLASQFISCKILPGNAISARYKNLALNAIFGRIFQGIHFLQGTFKILQSSARVKESSATSDKLPVAAGNSCAFCMRCLPLRLKKICLLHR